NTFVTTFVVQTRIGQPPGFVDVTTTEPFTWPASPRIEPGVCARLIEAASMPVRAMRDLLSFFIQNSFLVLSLFFGLLFKHHTTPARLWSYGVFHAHSRVGNACLPRGISLVLLQQWRKRGETLPGISIAGYEKPRTPFELGPRTPFLC